MRQPQKPAHIAVFIISLILIFNTIIVIAIVETSRYLFFSWEGWVSQIFYPPSFFVVLLLSSVIALVSWAIANKAQKAGRSWAAFFWLSAVVSPIIMGIIAVTLKPLDSPATIPSAKPPKPSGNLESELVQLQNLREKGILSEAEFTEAKKKALGL